MKVSVNEVAVNREDINAVIKTLENGWFSSSGPTVKEFEDKWAQYCNRQFGVSVSNGSTALLTAFLALDLTPGAEVIMPDFTIISCASAIIQAGYIPIFVDCELDTFNIDTSKIEERITQKTEAILIVHIYGHPSQAVQIKAIAELYKLKVIEDAAEAHGARYRDESNKWVKCGSQFDMSTFSFFANKVITTGEGGMVVTNQDTLAERMRQIRNLYFPEAREYTHEKIGYQFRLGSMQAAFGISQIARIDEILEKKRMINTRYRENIGDFQRIKFQKISEQVESNYWVISVLLKDETFDSDLVRNKLLSREIETRPFFTGMHAQPALRSINHNETRTFPNSEYASKYGLILPSGTSTSLEQIDYVCEILMDVLK